MIQSFRIGNYINDYEVNEGYFRVEEIKDNGQGNLAVYYRNGSCMSINPEPIPLTEEILLKCAFIRHHDDYYNTRIYIKNVVNNVGFEWGCFPIELGSGLIVSNIKLKYLHQLQNLYFALTNEELTINL